MNESQISSRPDWASRVPIASDEVELSAPLLPPPRENQSGVPYGAAQLLVRLHTQPIGIAYVEPAAEGFTADTCAAAIWLQLSEQINRHLTSDGLPTISDLDGRGISTDPDALTPCLARRRAVLENPPFISVVLCTKDRPQILGRALESLMQLEYPSYETLVIDGSKGDETKDLVTQQFPTVKYHRLPDGRLIVGRNRGLAEANGEIVAFTDDDAVIDRHWLSEHAATFAADPDVVCSTGPAFPLVLETKAQVWFEEFGGFSRGLEPRTLSLATREPGSLLPFATGRIGSGVNMVWRAVVARQQEFDPALDELGAEDIASFFDALCDGHSVAFTPGALLWHEHRVSYEGLERQIEYYALGLGAYLLRAILRQPSRFGEFLIRMPLGLRYAFGSSSARNDQRSPGFPKELDRRQYGWLLRGAPAYLNALRKVRVRRRWAAKGWRP